MAIKPLSLDEAEFIAHRYAVEVLTYTNEPIPPFNTRYPGRLESCLAQPFVTSNGRYVHYRLTKRAAVLFYFIAKNQCFMNGNKRMAVTLTMVFFYINKKWLNMPNKDLYDIACEVGKSEPKKQELVIKALEDTFKAYITSR